MYKHTFLELNKNNYSTKFTEKFDALKTGMTPQTLLWGVKVTPHNIFLIFRPGYAPGPGPGND